MSRAACARRGAALRRPRPRRRRDASGGTMALASAVRIVDVGVSGMEGHVELLTTRAAARSRATCSAARRTMAIAVSVGFRPEPVTKTLVSQMNRFGMSCDWQNALTTDVRRIVAHAARAHRVRAVVQADADRARAGGAPSSRTPCRARRRRARRRCRPTHRSAAPPAGRARPSRSGSSVTVLSLVRQAFGVRPPRGGVGVVVEELLELGAEERAAQSWRR